MSFRHSVPGAVLAFVIGLVRPGTTAWAEEGTAAERLRALLAEYHAGSAAFRKATTDEERRAAVESMDRYALRFTELAESHPVDPVALEAALEAVRAMNSVDSLTQVTWEMNRSAFPERTSEDAAARVVALLLRDHVRSEKLGPIAQRMSYGLRREYGTLLRAVLEKNPSREVRGTACLALAQFLNGLLLKLDLLADRPELAGRYERLLGKEHFEELRRQDRARAGKEVEAFFEKAAAEYDDVKFYDGTVGAKARSELHEIRRLAAGRPAPEIEGVDQDGKRFKLSDYRGKAVLLDFWQEL